MTDLKPCPFCGGEASHSEERGEPTIRVNHEQGCFLGALTIRGNDEAVEAWNRRAGETKGTVSAMPTDEERRKIAAELREHRDPLTPYNLVEYIFDDPWNHYSGEEVACRLADLIEPEERTCYIEHIDEDSFHLSCGHEAAGHVSPSFCPSCGAEVVE